MDKDTINLQVWHVGEDTEACKLPGHQGWLKHTAI